MKAIIYCACKEADEEICRVCEKRRLIKPDIRFYAANWPRKVK